MLPRCTHLKPEHLHVLSARLGRWRKRRKLRRCRDMDLTCLCRGRERLDLYGVAKVSQAFDQGFFLLIGGTEIEVIAAEVVIHRPVL
jgi:hypothetical protein